MSEPMGTVREAVGVFDDWSSLEAAVDALREAGFPKEAFSLLADQATVEGKLGHVYARVEELEDDPAAPRTAFTSTKAIGAREDMVVSSLTVLPTVIAASIVVASAGALAAAIAGTAVVGATLGTVLANWIDKRHVDRLEEQLQKGGILLWVRTPDEVAERKAITILTEHADHDVHIHEIPQPG